jgi:hypothetical protein
MQHVAVKKFDAFHRLRHIAPVSVGAVLLAVSLVALSFAQKSTPESFPSAEAASHALYVAVQSDNEQAVTQILGGETELVSTNDSAEDKLEREHFSKKYEEMHRLVREPDGTTVLYVGAENWPFPIPLVSKGGAWYFDVATGKEEVLFRRIGENEATAIETCHALAQIKQRQETSTTGGDPVTQYAKTFVSANAGGDAPNSGEEPSGPFHGYYFRMLTGQSKGAAASKTTFAFVAYPVEYRSSGVMTFAVTQDGAVYKKDLGPGSEKLAKKMTGGTRSSSWHAAD